MRRVAPTRIVAVLGAFAAFVACGAFGEGGEDSVSPPGHDAASDWAQLGLAPADDQSDFERTVGQWELERTFGASITDEETGKQVLRTVNTIAEFIQANGGQRRP